MGVHNRQPLAKVKGVHPEVESEGSLRQSPAPRNMNHIRHNRWDETAKQVEVQRLCGHRSVNVAGTWDEGYLSYHGLATGEIMDVWKRSMNYGVKLAKSSQQRP